ncbi:TPA: hypothetical protein ACYUTM_004922 [Serratia marcescens]|uniref:hypothetical protein n=1 Tax=Serratia sp. TMDUHS_CL TaxID=3128862 RepID=UPI0029D656C7|nr:hypothetical protein [Serratia marcescens]BEM86852.1 hypothetical protein SME46J_13220 [Serratia marcescens]BEM87913.1 hypothetical protein SME46J_23830 [Serratia marcescens]
MNHDWNIHAEHVDYVEPDYSYFANQNYPSSCRLQVRGGIRLDRRSLRAEIYFFAISQVSDISPFWSEDTYESTDLDSRRIITYRPKLQRLSVTVYHQVFMGTGKEDGLEKLELSFGDELTMGMTPKLFDENGKILYFVCAQTRDQIPFGSKNSTLFCEMIGSKFGGYWAGSHSGLYGDSMKPDKRTDNVDFKHNFTTAVIPALRDIKLTE